jgi:NTE family protein
MKVGLALSGGGIRCMAHIGMMQALEEEGVKFDVVAGASGGALGGALHCAGYSPKEILEIIESINFLKVLKPALNWRGLLKLEAAAPLVASYFKEDSFDTLLKPLVVSATNLKKGKAKYFKKGQLVKPLLASCSIPVVFDPIVINGTPYIDGGVLDNLPVSPLKKCDYIIGLHCNPIADDFKVTNWRGLMERSLLMAISSGTYLNRKKCDLFWEPQEVWNYKVYDFKKARELYRIGYRYAQRQFEVNPLPFHIKCIGSQI